MGGEAASLLEDFGNKSYTTRKHIASRIQKKASEDPENLLDVVPAIEPHITDPSNHVRKNLIYAIGKVAREYPEEVLPVVPKLEERFEQGIDESDALKGGDTFDAMFALGMVAKQYPNIAKNNIPRFVEVTRTSDKYVSNNAMALLADLADEYSDEIIEYLSILLEELDSEDKYMRYNSLTVAARVAKDYPTVVKEELGTERLIDMLEENSERIRENACWALLHLGEDAESAIPKLQELAEQDPSETIQNIAEQAIKKIREK